MAIGEFLGKLYNSYKGTDENGDPTKQGMRMQALGSLYDYWDARNESKAADARAEQMLREQQAIAQQQLALAQRRAQEEQQIRDGIIRRTAMLDQALAQAYSAMGDYQRARPEDIQSNYQQIYDEMDRDLTKSVNEVASKGFASAISRGMDRSGQFDAEQAKLAAKVADQRDKNRQEAYNAAINRTTKYYDTLNAGRTETLKELDTVYGTGIDNLKNAMPTNAGTLYSNANTSNRSLYTDANTSASNADAVEGRIMADLSNKYASNLDYMLGNSSNYQAPANTELEKLKQQNADLQARLKKLTG